MRRFVLGSLMAISVLVASCATGPNQSADVPHKAEAKQCSDTPRNAITIFMQGLKEFSLALLNMVTHEKTSLREIFGGGDAQRGAEVVRQIAANPEVSGESGSCACSFLSMTDTDDPNRKIVWIKRVITVDDDVRNYRRSFNVQFETHSNCILAINPIDTKWERF